MRIQHTLSAVLAGLLLAAALSAPALAAEDTRIRTREEAARHAVQLAAEYGGADSIRYALWEGGEITLQGGWGVYSRSENRALTEDILYGVGSVSKTYTAAAVLKLCEEGALTLETPVAEILPEFCMADERYQSITVRMLLDHSSGLMGDSTRNAFLFDDTDPQAADALLRRLATQRLKAEPGAYCVYSNDGYTLAELVVEAASGMEYMDYVRAALLAPGELADTFAPGGDFDPDRLARTYASPQDPRALPQDTLGIVGTGGIYATASDLAAFGGAVFCEDGILSADAIAASMADEYARGIWPEDTEDVVSYGLGWDSVHWYPFAYSGIQAVTKGGDTILYHAGLVVIPEYDMAAAVLSSGGVSTYNEMAASQMLIAALAEQGVAVDQTPHTLPAAERAEMPAELMDYAGLYGDSTSAVMLTVTADGVLSTGNAPLYYYSDGSFRDENQMVMLKFVEEDNGQTYLWQKAYSSIPGLGEQPSSSYIYMKLPDNPVPPEAQSAWDARSGKLYLALNMKYTNIQYPLALPVAAVATDPVNMPGYMVFDRILDADRAEGVAQIPGLYGRDWQNITMTERNGVEYLSTCGGLYMDSAAAEPLFGGASSWSTIQADGYARWYQVGSAAGKTMTVQVPEHGGFAVYDAAGLPVAASWAWGDTSAVLPEGGWVVFSGTPGARFVLSLTADEEK